MRHFLRGVQDNRAEVALIEIRSLLKVSDYFMFCMALYIVRSNIL